MFMYLRIKTCINLESGFGSKLTLRIKTTDRSGSPISANLALSVTNTLRTGHNLYEPDITSYFELYSYPEKPYP